MYLCIASSHDLHKEENADAKEFNFCAVHIVQREENY